MSNYCTNRVIITHKDKSAVDKIVKAAKTGLFNYFIPVSDELESTDFCWNEWGTKWDVTTDCENAMLTITPGVDSGELLMWFDTAWAPPIPFYEFLIKQGYNVHATYYVLDGNFIGSFNGKHHEYSMNKCPKAILDSFGLAEMSPGEFEVIHDYRPMHPIKVIYDAFWKIHTSTPLLQEVFDCVGESVA